MRWDDFRRSDNIDDDRGGGGGGFGFPGGGGGGGGGFGIPIGGGGLGIGTVIVLGIIGYVFGIDPSVLIGGAEIVTGGSGYNQPYQQPQQRRSTRAAPTDPAGQFIAAVLGNTEDTWTEIFKASGRQYRAPRLVLFNRYDQGGCGTAQSATGPFYCPNDQRIYIDTSFFKDIEQRFKGCSGKACEFSRAYVIAHEVGHHVQNLTGILPRATQAQHSAGNQAAANRIQVRIELQADCYAGVWANRSNQKWKFIEPGDIEAALQTAAAIGDDRLQKQTRGSVMPDSFTHGSSEQRQRWFSAGYKDGKTSACDTFAAGAQL
jgi:predicted metalloprotease